MTTSQLVERNCRRAQIMARMADVHRWEDDGGAVLVDRRPLKIRSENR